MNLNKNLYIDSYLFSSPDSFDVLKKGAGCDRILFGSGAPLKYINSAIQIIEKSNLNEDDKNKIFYSNLKKLLVEV
jgi:predicted TIM-barrel fold metal-dependent hydrolase